MKRGALALGLLALAVAACGRVSGHPRGEPDAPLPDVARVICDGDGTSVTTLEVRPQPDGVHVVVDNRTDIDLGIAFDSGFEAGGHNADRGSSNHIWLAPPGPVTVRCQGPEGQPRLEGGPSFTVRDPVGLWVSPELDCASGGLGSGSASHGSPPKGDPRDPVTIAEERFAPLGPGGRVEAAGYPEAERRLVLLIREGRAVALVEYVDASFAGGEPGSGWVEDLYSACAEATR